jgi:hypothetical protein
MSRRMQNRASSERERISWSFLPQQSEQNLRLQRRCDESRDAERPAVLSTLPCDRHRFDWRCALDAAMVSLRELRSHLGGRPAEAA